MIVEQIIKILNSTELGLKGANERYVQCRQIECLEEWHRDADSSHKIFFKDKRTKKEEPFNIYYKGQIRGESAAENRENRIASSKNYFVTLNDLKPGDEIIFEKVTSTNDSKINNSEYFVNVKKNENIVIFQNNNKSLEILNVDRLNNIIKDRGPKFRLNFNNEMVIIEFIFITETNCTIEITKDDQSILNLNKINSDHILKFDIINKKLTEIDPLIYSRFKY
jgi:hypothetical protein